MAIAIASLAGSASSAARMPVRRRSRGGSRLHLSREVGGGHGIGDGASAHRGRRRATAAAPLVDFAARDVDPVEQQLEMILRVALVTPRGSVGPILVRAERVPFLVAHHIGQRQRRQHDRAAFHPRDSAQQGGDGRRGGGDAGGDGEAGGRLAGPAGRRRAEQAIATVGQVDCPAPRELGRPRGDNGLQPVERFLPVSGEILGFQSRSSRDGSRTLPRS